MAEQSGEKYLVKVDVAEVTGVPNKELKRSWLTGQPRKFHVSIALDSEKRKTPSVPAETDQPDDQPLIRWHTTTTDQRQAASIFMVASDQSSRITVRLFAEHTIRTAVCIGTFEQALSELCPEIDDKRHVKPDLNTSVEPPTKISFAVEITKIDRQEAGDNGVRQQDRPEFCQRGFFSRLRVK